MQPTDQFVGQPGMEPPEVDPTDLFVGHPGMELPEKAMPMEALAHHLQGLAELIRVGAILNRV